MSNKGYFQRIVLFVLFFWVCVYLERKATQPVFYLFSNEFHTQPCNLPVLDPFDSSVMKFSRKPKPVKCDDFPSIVFVDQNNVLHLNRSALSFYGLNSSSEVSCLVESVFRNGDDDNIGYTLPKNVILPAQINSDFNRVTCKSREDKGLFNNLVAGITPNSKIDNETLEETDEQLSVLMFGIDSVSRSASVRYLPKTLEVLRKLGSYDFKGLMKNGDNTIPNIMSQQTGLKLFQDSETIGIIDNNFDAYPFLWKDFSERKYVTLFAEDDPELAMFNLDLKGFTKPPTDHYMRPYWLALRHEERKRIRHHVDSWLRWLEDSGIQLSNSPLCNQNTMKHIEIINYIKRFMLHYRSKRKFIISFLTELSHGSNNVIHYADEDLRDFFLWMKTEGFLNRTVVVLFGDHGSRYEPIRNTFVGRMESRMPMLHILIPDHIKRRYPEVHRNLNINTHRLTTHFDTYQTMVDILHRNFRNPSIQLYNGVKRGVSLFREIPSSRSCVDAHINATFCACYKSTPLNITNNKYLQKIADAIVKHLNEMLKSESNCKVLTLKRILSAEKISQGLNFRGANNAWYNFYRYIKPPEGSRDSYIETIETVPGHATFDALVEIDPNGTVKDIKNIDRTNAYDNQSACISDKKLKQFCYC